MMRAHSRRGAIRKDPITGLGYFEGICLVAGIFAGPIIMILAVVGIIAAAWIPR